MKRIACLVLLTAALSSPASARGSYSFVVHGHRIHIPAHCRSMSCVSVTNLRRHRDADDVATVNDPAPAPAPAAAPAAPLAPPPAPPPPAVAPPPTQPLSGPSTARVAPPAPAPLPPITRAAPMPPAPIAPPQPVQSRPSPVPAPTLAAAPTPPSVGFEAPRPPQPVPVAPAARPAETTPQDRPQERIQVATLPPASQVARAAQQSEDDDDSPIGDWQTEEKNGLVRIENCGEAFCGYMLNANTKAKGETILVNMKLKKNNQWAGNVYSRSSGNSYYGTMTLKEGNSLRVEACALGSFFCSGNTWTRYEDSRSIRPADVANSPQNAPSPRS
jgi:uncharacterized protein (DUF2147 family)